MSDIYEFSSEELKDIDLLKKILIIKRGNFKAYKFRKEKEGFYKFIVLYAPKLYNENTINAYILKNQYNIYKMAYKCFFKKTDLLENTQNHILFLGKVYKIDYDKSLQTDFILNDEENIIQTKHNINIPYKKSKFLEEQAFKILPERLNMYAEKFKLYIKNIKIKNYKSLWGACYTDNTILLNKRLILCPKPTIDAIICHELAHIMHPNHSKDFYATLEKIYPSYYKDYIWLNIYKTDNIID